MLAFISHSLCVLRVCVSMQVGFFGILSGNIFWEIIRANNYLEFQGKWTQIRGIGFLLIPGAINSDQVRLILKPFWIVGENVTFLFSLFGETSSNFFSKKIKSNRGFAEEGSSFIRSIRRNDVNIIFFSIFRFIHVFKVVEVLKTRLGCGARFLV